MRVAHVLGSLDVGGAEMRTLEMAKSLARESIRFDVIAISGREGALARNLESIGGRVFVLHVDSSFPYRFIRLLQRESFDAVHSHVATASGAILRMSQTAHVPIRIAHFHSDSDGRADNPRRLVQRAVLRSAIRRSATAAIGVSEASLDFHFGRRWRSDPRCAVLPDGLDLERLVPSERLEIREHLSIPEAAPLLIHVGRTAYEKNRERLIPLLARLRLALEPHLLVVGAITHDERARLLASAASWGVISQVHILGHRDDVPALIGQADLMLLPSRREGLPGVILEACALGTPVVASSLPGIQALTEHFASLVLVPLEESDETWCHAMKEVLAWGRPSGVDRLAAHSRFRISPYAIESVRGAYRALYVVRSRA